MARATRYTARYTSAATWPKKLSLKNMVSLDLSLQRHLTGPLESSLQDVFRWLLKHQWETNCKLRLPRFRACASSFTGPLTLKGRASNFSGPKIVKIADSDSGISSRLDQDLENLPVRNPRRLL